MRGSAAGEKSQSTHSGRSPGVFSSFRTTASSSSRTHTLGTSLMFARQRSSDSSVLSSLQGEPHSLGTAEATVFPDTINPEFQPTGSAAAAAHAKSPLATPAEELDVHSQSPLFADLASDYAMHASEGPGMPPNQTLDQMLAQDSQGTQQLLPLQQKQDSVLQVNALADAASGRQPTIPSPPPPAAVPKPVNASCQSLSNLQPHQTTSCQPFDRVSSTSRWTSQKPNNSSARSHSVATPVVLSQSRQTDELQKPKQEN